MKPRVMVIDDLDSARQMVKRALSPRCEVYDFAGVKEALPALDRAEMTPHRPGEFHVVVRQHIRVREPQQHRRANARRGRVVRVVGIAERGHPSMRVVRRMVYPSRAAEPPVRMRDAEMIVESGEVRSAARITHARLRRLKRWS